MFLTVNCKLVFLCIKKSPYTLYDDFNQSRHYSKFILEAAWARGSHLRAEAEGPGVGASRNRLVDRIFGTDCGLLP